MQSKLQVLKKLSQDYKKPANTKTGDIESKIIALEDPN